MLEEKKKKNKGIISIIIIILLLSTLIGSGLFVYKSNSKSGHIKAQNTADSSKNISLNISTNSLLEAKEKLRTENQDNSRNIISSNPDNNSNITIKNQSQLTLPVATTGTEIVKTDKPADTGKSILELVNRPDRDKLFNPPIPFSMKVFGYNKSAGKVVALTFDDGPSKEFTKKYVDILKSMDVKATFFVIGKNAAKFPDLLKYISESGNEIGIHSYNHFFMPKMKPEQMADELYSTQKIIVDVTGSKSSLFRPPYGAFNETLLKISNALGLHVVLWNVDPDDWKNPGIQNIVNRIVSHAKDGSVILMHEGKPETIAALPQIIEKLKAEGYGFVTVSELLNYGKNKAENGNEFDKSTLQQQNSVSNTN